MWIWVSAPGTLSIVLQEPKLLVVMNSNTDPGASAIASGLAAAQAACRGNGLRFTRVRSAVLETLLRAGHPVGAYDVVARLETLLGRRPPAQTVYRALDFLVEQHFVSRIESKNAFIACAHPDHPHACVFLLCDFCGTSTELESEQLEAIFHRAAATVGFRIAKPVVELQGTCLACQVPSATGQAK